MGIKICPDCGGKVSESRNECIHCGYIFKDAPQEENKMETPVQESVEVEQPNVIDENPDIEVSPQINDESSQACCPYCGSSDSSQFGISLNVCNVCKMKYVSDVVQSAPIIITKTSPVAATAVSNGVENIVLDNSNNLENKETAEEIIDKVPEKTVEEINAEKYKEALGLKDSGELQKAIDLFKTIEDFSDSKQQIEKCVEILNEQVYEKALTFENEKDYKNAIDVFATILDYKDSKQQIEKCVEILNEQAYEKALTFENEKDYKNAIDVFATILDYKDSKNHHDNCVNIVTTEEKYQNALSCRGSNNIKKYKSAIVLLNEIGDYKDSKVLFDEYNNNIEVLSKKQKRAFAISGSSIGAAIIAVVLVITVFIPLARINKIQTLVDGRKYNEATELIGKISNEEKREKYTLLTKAGEAFEVGDYELGIDCIYCAKGTVKVSYVTNGGKIDTYNETIKHRKNTYINKTPTRFGYAFDSWSLSNYSIDSKSMSASISLGARFVKLDTLLYGLYPQTHVSDSTLISNLNSLTSSDVNSVGYYSYNDELYYSYVATQNRYQNNKFEDGTDIESGNKYWFKVEPIEWKVLDDSNEAFVTSTKIIDASRYNEIYHTNDSYIGTKLVTDYQGNTAEVYGNNYKYSEIRSWLNTGFYDMAFHNEDSHIEQTIVDNSASTTNPSSNRWVCENTNDKVFLPSYQDIKNSSYGFDGEYKPTDFALARGAGYISIYYNGLLYRSVPYWTRSPSDFPNPDNAYINKVFNECSSDSIEHSNGVRPAMKLTLD